MRKSKLTKPKITVLVIFEPYLPVRKSPKFSIMHEIYIFRQWQKYKPLVQLLQHVRLLLVVIFLITLKIKEPLLLVRVLIASTWSARSNANAKPDIKLSPVNVEISTSVKMALTIVLLLLRVSEYSWVRLYRTFCKSGKAEKIFGNNFDNFVSFLLIFSMESIHLAVNST